MIKILIMFYFQLLFFIFRFKLISHPCRFDQFISRSCLFSNSISCPSRFVQTISWLSRWPTSRSCWPIVSHLFIKASSRPITFSWSNTSWIRPLSSPVSLVGLDTILCLFGTCIGFQDLSLKLIQVTPYGKEARLKISDYQKYELYMLRVCDEPS